MKRLGTFNHYRTDPSAWVGSIVMFSFASIAAFKWLQTGAVFFALLVLRDLVAVYFLLIRNQAASKSCGIMDFISYLSCAIPFLYLPADHFHSLISANSASVLAIVGFSLSTLALFDLGKSFGVTPANRGKVSTGVYRLLSHPMYMGYALAEFGFILLNPLNAVIYCVSIGLYIFRARKENMALQHFC